MSSSARGENSNPYDGGLGAGGKFRKRPIRRSHTTPYDRPPNSLRNPNLGGVEGGGNGNRGGWISRLVDPAQRLITYGAHRIFGSVFRKRLPQGDAPLQQEVPENEVNEYTEEDDSKNIHSLPMNDVVQMEHTIPSADRTNMMIKDRLSDLEKILKQKTFTRSEIDRLTKLLRSKAADSSTGKQEQQRAEEINVIPFPSSDQEPTHTMSMENGNQNNFVSTPIGSSRVVDECIASPAELAKAYMGSRPSEVSPSMLGLRGQTVREDSVFLSNTPFPSKLSTMSLVPKSSGKNLLPDNGFNTSRSRGRTAVYSMVRTPYSRPQSTVKSTREESIPSGSRQGVQMSLLKRRSSVLDNDTGSVGPVRRIRQKSNLLSRNLALPASGSQRASSSHQQVVPNSTHMSNGSAKDIPVLSFNPVPSKSSEMASKILQQLDKLVSTREKSPTKLSPSMLHGPALKSLQHVEAPKFLGSLQEKNLGGSPSSGAQKEDIHKENDSREVLALPEKPVSAVNTITVTALRKDQDVGVKGTYLPTTNSMEEHPAKKRAFRMSAHEDLVELDDDHDVASISPVEVREQKNASKVENDTGIAKVTWEKPRASSEVKPLATYVSNGNTSNGTSNGTVESGKSSEFKFAAFASEAVQQGNMGADSVSKFSKGASTEQSIISPAIFGSVEKIDSVKEPSKVPPIMPSTFSSSLVASPLDQKFGAASDTKSGKPSSFTFGTSEPMTKLPESDKIVGNSASGAGSTTSSASTLNGSIFSFRATAASPSPNKGSPASSPLFPPKVLDLSSTSSTTQSTSAVQSFAPTPSTNNIFGISPAGTDKDSNSGSISVLNSAPNFSTTPTFKFGESAASVAASTVSSSTDQVSKETGVKDSIFGNLASIPSAGIASTIPSTGSSTFSDRSSAFKSAQSVVFGGSTAIADAGSNIFGGSAAAVGGSTSNTSIAASPSVGSGGSSIFGVASSSTSATGTNIFSSGSASTTTSSIFGASSPALASSGSSLFGGTAMSTGNSIFGFSAGATASASSSQSQTSNLFGAVNAQPGISGSGTTNSTQSSLFQFGSSASTHAFGSSASTPTFGLSGNTSTASSSSLFGSSASGTLLFGSGSASQFGSSPSLEKSASSSSVTTSSAFCSNWQPSPSNSTPVFGSSFNSSSAPTFSFGGPSSSASGSSTATPIFGSSASAPSSSSMFAFNSTPAAAPSQPVFGGSAPAVTLSQPVFGGSTAGFAFGAATNNDQMSMEDSMAEDTDQARTTAVPAFGQPPPQPTFGFGAAAATPPSGASPFQFGSQQNPQSPSPFQGTSSLEFNGGGSFSLGSTGADKSGRKFIRVSKRRAKK